MSVLDHDNVVVSVVARVGCTAVSKKTVVDGLLLVGTRRKKKRKIADESEHPIGATLPLPLGARARQLI